MRNVKTAFGIVCCLAAVCILGACQGNKECCGSEASKDVAAGSEEHCAEGCAKPCCENKACEACDGPCTGACKK